MMFSLRTFGSLALTRDGSSVAPLGSHRKTMVILTVLATDGTVSRDRLMALLWPESDIERARGSLKQAIHTLRQQLQAPDLILGRVDLSLNPALIESDVQRFRDALNLGDVLPAVTLYQGAFLEGAHLNGSVELEQWVDARRAALALLYREGLERLARAAEARGDSAEALRWWTRRTGEDPLDGTAALRQMQILEASGQPTAALQHFRTHESILRRELGLAPDPAITALAKRLRSIPPATTTVKPDEPVRVATTAPSFDASTLVRSTAPPLVAGGGNRWLRRWRWAAAIILALGGLLGWRLLTRGRELPLAISTAEPAVAVLPYRVVGPGVEYLREGMVDLLSFNIEGIQGLRKIDPATVLTAWTRLRNSASDDVDQRTALEVARRVQARYLVMGSAVQLGDDVRLVAEVQDVEQGEIRGTAQVSGPMDSVSSLVDQLTLELLRLNLLPSDGEHRPVSLSVVTTPSLPALKAYLAGEREYRVARWREAGQHYLRAIKLDSTFARALYRLIKANDWGPQGTGGNLEYARRLVPLVARLPERDRLLIQGDRGAAAGIAILDTLTRRYPDDVEGWVALGERTYHDHGQVLLPPSTYRNAFSKAIQLNPHYREPYLHLIEDAFFRLDSAGARRLIEEYAAIDGSQAGCTNQLAFDLVWASDVTRERALAALDTIPPSVIWSSCLPSIGPFPAPPRVQDKLMKMYQAIADTASDPRSTLLAFFNLHMRVLAPRGQIAAIQRTLAGMEGVTGPAGWWVERWQIMLHLSDFPDSVAAHRAAMTLVENAHPFAGFWIGILAGAEGRWADADQSGRALDRRVQDLVTVGDTVGASAVRAHATALRAYLNFVRGDRSRLEDLELALRQLPPRTFAPPEAYLRYQVGKLLFERGQLRDAERYFLSFGPMGFYTSQAELYLGRITEALGRPNDALEHYRRFITWWQYADPALRAPLEEARAALSRLTGEGDN